MKKVIFGIIHLHNIMLLLLIGVIMFRVWQSSPDNHWGFDIRYGFILCLLNVIFCTLGLHFYGKDKWLLIGISISLLSGLFLFVVDYFNVIVGYELWLKRGMPDMWQPR